MALQFPITDADVSRAASVHSIWRTSEVMAAVKELQDAATLGQPISWFNDGVIGVDVGVGSDGMMLGNLTEQALTKFFLASHARAPLAIADDGGAYTNETTEAGESTGNDMTLFPAAPAVDDAYYFGDATVQFGRLDVNITTKQVDEIMTAVWEYWDSVTEDWALCQVVSDATETLLVNATGWKTLQFVKSANWGKCTVDGVYGYWIRCRVSAFTSITTAPAGGQAYAVETIADPLLCITDDGGVQTIETVDMYDAGADDFVIWAADQALADAVYFGGAVPWSVASVTYGQETDSDATVVYEYWNGTAWTTVAVTDTSTAFTVAAGTKTLTLDAGAPSDWVAVAVNGVTGYWLRLRCSVAGTVTQSATGSYGYITTKPSEALTETYADDTTDINDAGAGDVDLLPAYPVLHDAGYVCHATKQFCSFVITTSQEATGTHTLTYEYWNGSAWATLTLTDDPSASFATTAATFRVNFVPPTDWASTTVNSQAGYFIRYRLSAMTSVTQQPQASQGWVRTMEDGTGWPVAAGGVVERIAFNARAVAPGANTDMVFFIVNITQGTLVAATWTKATQADSVTGLSLDVDAGDEIAVIMAEEDGTTEADDVNFSIGLAAA